MKIRRASPITKSHPCIFSGEVIRHEIDPQVKQLWVGRFGGKTPFGALRQMYREMHCATINPYDSTYCPYSEEECAISFLSCVTATVAGAGSGRHAKGYFRAVAHTRGLDRADHRPLARDRYEARLDQTKTPSGPGDGGSAGDRAAAGPAAGAGTQDGPPGGDGDGLRSRVSRPEHIGALLRALDLGPHPGPADDGQESPE